MKKFFEYIGILSLVCFSFFLTDKTVSVVQEIDDIMIQIRKEQENYNQNGIDATINGNYIIPGLPKKTVNIEKSYNEMKKVGVYNSNLYIYDIEKPIENLSNHLDKYIVSGNSKKRYVSIILILKETKLEMISSYLNERKFSVVLSNEAIQSQIKEVEKMIENGNEFIMGEEKKQEFVSLKQKLNTLKNPATICYNPMESNEFLSLCKKNEYYTVTSKVISKNPLSKTKELLMPGAFLTFEVNNQFLKEFPTILSYIESRGYEIKPLSIHIKED